MIVGETFVVNIHRLSIDECINLLELNLDGELIEQIKNLIIVKKLIKVISERDRLPEYHSIYKMVNRIEIYCRRKFLNMQNVEHKDVELIRQFKEFQRIHSTKCYNRKEVLFTIFYAERAIIEIYY